jgi:hypothetical protein
MLWGRKVTAELSRGETRPAGLDNVAQAAFTKCHALIRGHLGIAGAEIAPCGTAPDRIDPAAPGKRLVTERRVVASFATLQGFRPASRVRRCTIELRAPGALQ